MTDINKEMEQVVSKIAEAQQILEVAKMSNNPKLLEKAQAALKQFMLLKEDLERRIPLEKPNEISKGFKLNINAGKVSQKTESDLVSEADELPPHLKR